MAGFENDIVVASNVDFSGGTPVQGQMQSDGDVLIGASSPPYVRVGQISAGPGMSVTNSPGDVQVNSIMIPSIPGIGGVSFNLSFHADATTIYIVDASGSDLSATNPGVITMPSNIDTSRIVYHLIEENQSLLISDLTDNTFGTVSGAPWVNEMIMYVGFVSDADDGGVEPFLMRIPHSHSTPSSSENMATPASCNANTQGSAFMWSNVTVDDYTDKSTVLIGSFRCAKNSDDEWSVTAFGHTDGIGRFNDNTELTFPPGQGGAGNGNYFVANAGTEPTFTTQNATYTVNVSGQVNVNYNLNDVNNTPSGGQGLQLTIPLAAASAQSYRSGLTYLGGLLNEYSEVKYSIPSAGVATDDTNLLLAGVGTIVGVGLLNSSFTSGDGLYGQIIYQAGTA